MDIRKHRFIPTIPTNTRIIAGNKERELRRAALKRQLAREVEEYIHRLSEEA